MKQLINNIVFVCSVALLITACKRDNLMDIKPTADIPDLNVYASNDQILNMVRSLYTTFKNGQFYGGRYLLYNDIRSEEFLNEKTNGVTGLQTWNHTLTNTVAEVNGLWSQAYLTINNCNIFLDGMDAKGTAVVGDSLSKNYTAEARLIRGFSYYSLLQLYARPYWDGNGSKPGLPLRLTGNKLRAEYQLARSSIADIYAQIFSDLNYAEANLPRAYSSAELNTTRAHRNTAIALKTRMYLSMQKYADVITEANKIVTASAPFTATTGVAHALQPDVTKIFTTYNTSESIFSHNLFRSSSVEEMGQMYCLLAASISGTVAVELLLPGMVSPNRNRSALLRPSPNNSIRRSVNNTLIRSPGVAKSAMV